MPFKYFRSIMISLHSCFITALMLYIILYKSTELSVLFRKPIECIAIFKKSFTLAFVTLGLNFVSMIEIGEAIFVIGWIEFMVCLSL
jgi:hypothetical protein